MSRGQNSQEAEREKAYDKITIWERHYGPATSIQRRQPLLQILLQVIDLFGVRRMRQPLVRSKINIPTHPFQNIERI